MAYKFWGYPLIFAFQDCRQPITGFRMASRKSMGREKSMAQLVVMYQTPTDVVAFDKHYSEKHIPLVEAIPGVRKYEISRGPVATPAGPSVYHLVAIVHFDGLVAIQKAFGSAEGQAAVADVQNFATGGVDIFMFDTREV